MKKIFLIIYLFPLLFNGQTDSQGLNNKEILIINQKGIGELVHKYKKILKSKGGVEGWRIQITFKTRREEILHVKNKFNTLYPEILSEIIFESPYYKLIAGNFRYRNEALKIQHIINKDFPASHPIPKIINPNLLK